ncbi:phenylalanine 4-monooxygenase [Streptomyces noursei]|uniref:phenylalanine 4-monooxygenase n=1 Tax=Streptomyces noursei TaxID=1971 RepID=UPI00167588B1|nr:phenylalanine 4-monooxygenase [Streptomyces noursei]MCZ1019537.1 phenylalanine 4-monooxygenase [Streptomyces noursei]GGX09308.1 phenylalanine-4-hydroxylase [Streptomyces noursei]
MSTVRKQTPVSVEGRLGRANEHPGRHDQDYRRRRDALAARAENHRVGAPYEDVAYTEDEHRTWRTVHDALAPAHRTHACREVLAAGEAADIPAERIPQHAEITPGLRTRTGFSLTLAGGVVPNERFLGAMAHGYFHAVQFVRHPAVPLYTPEPDVLHDVFGHGIHLSSPGIAELYRVIGRAANRVRTAEALDILSRVYWYTLEYGLITESGGPKAFGAALLSSYGEIAAHEVREVRELDLCAAASTQYRISGYQSVLFAARSFSHLEDTIGGFCAEFDDDTGNRLGLPSLPRDRQ